MLKKSAFYIVAVLFIFAGQFLVTGDLVTGKPPRIEQSTLAGHQAMPALKQGPALVYFWAEWCGICQGMQDNVSRVLQDYPGLTVAERSGNYEEVTAYLSKNKLNWPVVNDPNGTIGQAYGIRGVPALFFIDRHGNIGITSVGYTSEWGLRFRLWLINFL